jgi:hypothetical protein
MPKGYFNHALATIEQWVKRSGDTMKGALTILGAGANVVRLEVHGRIRSGSPGQTDGGMWCNNATTLFVGDVTNGAVGFWNNGNWWLQVFSGWVTIPGGLRTSTGRAVGSTTLLATDYYIASSGPTTITLPPATNAGQRLIIQKANGGASPTFDVTIVRQGANVIGWAGATSITLTVQDQAVELMADGSNRWYRLK